MPKFSGELLRQARKRAGLSREQTAVAAGVSVSSIERWEQGTRHPGVEAAVSLTGVLGGTVEDLMKDDVSGPGNTPSGQRPGSVPVVADMGSRRRRGYGRGLAAHADTLTEAAS